MLKIIRINMMTREQYDFSNLFWEDPEWNLDIPKCYVTDDNENFNFKFLNNDELKEFIKIKAKENPEVMMDVRYKKLKRILKTNK